LPRRLALRLDGDGRAALSAGTVAEAFCKLAERGLRTDDGYDTDTRRAEGFSCEAVAA
jgi:hypothetical protein